jgi:hypothetical protein
MPKNHFLIIFEWNSYLAGGGGQIKNLIYAFIP